VRGGIANAFVFLVHAKKDFTDLVCIFYLSEAANRQGMLSLKTAVNQFLSMFQTPYGLGAV